MTWALVRSWHALRPDDAGAPTTYCGLDATGRQTADTLPAGKSCESCLRILARITDDATQAAG